MADVTAKVCCRRIVFFFQAEDGIRDLTVTGVQTCALPIFAGGVSPHPDRDGTPPCRETVGGVTSVTRRPPRLLRASVSPPPSLRHGCNGAESLIGNGNVTHVTTN